MHITPAWCPSCTCQKSTPLSPVSELSGWNRPDVDGTDLGKQSPVQQHAGVKRGPGFSKGEPGNVISIQVLKEFEFYYQHCYCLLRNTIWRRFFWWGNSPTITTTSTTVLQPARPFTAVKTAGTNTTHSDFSGKSQVSFLCLSSTTQLGFLCNLISNKPIFWAARTQTEMEISQIHSLAGSRQDGGSLPSGRQSLQSRHWSSSCCSQRALTKCHYLTTHQNDHATLFP